MKAVKRAIKGLGRSVAMFGIIWLGIGVLTAFTGPSLIHAQAVSPPGDVFKVSYFDVGGFSGVADNEVRIINPTKANGDLCAMLYVFDHNEELQECCGCPLSPHDLLPLSVSKDLISNHWGTASFQDGVVEVVSAIPNNLTPSCSAAAGCVGGCDPTALYKPTPQLNAWITHAEAISPSDSAPAATIASASVSELTSAAYDQAEKAYLIDTCQLIVSDGSGAGVCSCGPEFSSTVVRKIH
jgi:hypothetical protein